MKKLLMMLCCCVGLITLAGQDAVWITTGSDAFDDIARVVGKRGPAYAVKVYEQKDGVTVTRIPAVQMRAVSEMMHDTHRRCGGYMVHDSLEEALAALNRDTAPAKAALVSYAIDNAATVGPMLADLDDQNIEDTILSLSSFYTRYHTTQTGTDAAQWIKAAWEDLATGRSDVSVSLYNHNNTVQPSVVLTITGALLPDEIVVIGGHLDSINGGASGQAPGADDNASGIATITEVLRVAMAHGYTPARTVKLMGYAAEEVGLVGSNEIAAAAQSAGDNVVGVVQFDMTNYNGSSPDIVMMTDYTNAGQNAFLGDLIDTYVGAAWAFDTCGYACSDHASWNNRGFAASMPFEAYLGQHNPYIHSSGDTLSVSGNNAVHALNFAKLGVAYLAELAKGGLNGDPGGSLPTTQNYSGSLARNQEVVFGPFSVDPGTAFSADVSGNGNVDLYVGFGSAPTTGSYDCASTSRNSNENCSLTVPSGAGSAYVMLRGGRKSNSYNLTVTYTQP